MDEEPLLPIPPPPEAPVISEVRRRLDEGDEAGAALVGFETAFRDFLTAFGFVPPPFWTYSDIFRLGVRTDMGYAPVLLARLYRLYEPVRYGRVRNVAAAELLDTLRQFYDQPALRRHPALRPGLTYGVWSQGESTETFPEPSDSPPGPSP